MNTQIRALNLKAYQLTFLMVFATILFVFAPAAFADEPVTMAPPVASQGGAPGGSAASSVFNWTDIPQNQQIPIRRATFDEGGYQLYDSVGETIIVPFQNQNLYAMKFATTPGDTMYFVNSGNAPILYVPQNGYLENATVAGARWYPFSPSFHPDTPVFVGIAPSWSVFIGMGWYPDMCCYGGYWCGTPFWGGGIFVPMIGLFFIIGGHHCDGWGNYGVFCNDHPWWHHTGFFSHNYYRWAAHPMLGRPPFGSVSRGGFGSHSFGSHSFGTAGGRSGFRGIRSMSGFHGARTGSFGGFRGSHGSTGFRGASSHAFGSAGGFRGGASSHAFGSAGGSFRGTSRTFRGAGGSFGSAGHSFGGTSGYYHSFNGGRGASGSHAFGGASRSFGGSGHSFGGGGHSFGGGQSFGGRGSGRSAGGPSSGRGRNR